MLTKSPRWHLQEFTRYPAEYLSLRGPIALKLIVGLPISILFLFFCFVTGRKIAMIPSAAFGHAVLEPELLQREIEAGLHKELKTEKLTWLFDAKIPSRYLVEIYGKRLYGELKLGLRIDFLKSTLSRYRLLSKETGSFRNLFITPKSGFPDWPYLDTLDLRSGSGPFIELDSKVTQKGDEFLEKLGIPKDAKIVCLSLRDSSWYEMHYGARSMQSLHTIRDVAIDSYFDAIEYLINAGYYVIRVGRSRYRVRFQVKYFFDYATSSLAGADLDFYLYQRCAFVFSNGTGDTGLATLFRKPHLLSNFTYAWMMSPTFYKTLFVPSYVLDSQTQCLLSITAIKARDFPVTPSSNTVRDLGLEIQPNSAAELSNAAKDMVELTTHPRWSLGMNGAQSAFWGWHDSNLEPQFKAQRDSYIAPSFFRGNPEMFQVPMRDANKA